MSRALRLIALAALVAAASAAEAAAPEQSCSWKPLVGSLGGLVLGFIQLAIGLGIAAFSITKGLEVVSKLLGGLDIWGEIKKKNVAVALLAAGVVLSYTRVIASGIDSMTQGLKSLATGGWASGLISLVAGLINLAVAIMVASLAITITFKVMDKLTKDIDEKAELAGGNVAVGVVYCGILIGVSGLVAAGVTGISTGFGTFLAALAGMVGIA